MSNVGVVKGAEANAKATRKSGYGGGGYADDVDAPAGGANSDGSSSEDDFSHFGVKEDAMSAKQRWSKIRAGVVMAAMFKGRLPDARGSRRSSSGGARQTHKDAEIEFSDAEGVDTDTDTDEDDDEQANNVGVGRRRSSATAPIRQHTRSSMISKKGSMQQFPSSGTSTSSRTPAKSDDRSLTSLAGSIGSWAGRKAKELANGGQSATGYHGGEEDEMHHAHAEVVVDADLTDASSSDSDSGDEHPVQQQQHPPADTGLNQASPLPLPQTPSAVIFSSEPEGSARGQSTLQYIKKNNKFNHGTITNSTML
jgi:hypothetical protein